MFGVRAAAVILVCLAASTTVHADTRYQQLRVPYGSPSDREKIFFHPDLELMGEDDGAYIVLSYPELTDQLRNRGIPFEIQYDDLSAHYREIQGPGTRGDFGSWHTYAETVAEMNAFHLQYPNLTTAPFSIGTTGEGRTIWAIKVSDNPTIDEPEPELLFDGVHHAREIMTVEMNLDFMHYLCANYGSDPVVSDIVDHREVFFVPIVNPDGFVYNELTDPAGGGLWRKNRRANAGGCFGVDNNRNYPYQWVGSGSSTDPCNETYRGPAANSEPENQAMVSFINSRHFTIWQSYHSVAGMVLFPWGYTTAHTGDDATFRAIATEMARDSGYQTGQPPEILYNVNGGAFDWGYGDTSQHTKIFAFTTEIGGSGFWPAPSERDPLIAENLHSNLYLCQIAGASLELVSLTVQGGNGRLDPGETAALVVTVRNGGVIVPANNVVATLRCDDPYVQLLDAATSLGNIAGGQQGASTLDPFDLTIASSCPDGRAVTFKVEMRAEDGTTGTGTIVLCVGQSPVIYANDFEEERGLVD
ncbi:MAG: M14 family zinc carboxypeptidase [Candidatus Eisenbacteria bacterium]